MNKELEIISEVRPGRPKGSLNKRNLEIFELAQELKCNPAKILMLIALGDAEALRCAPEEMDVDRRMAAADKLMPYLYGKRKPIDAEGDDSSSMIVDLLMALHDRG